MIRVKIRAFLPGALLAFALSCAAAPRPPLRIATFNLKWLTSSVSESRMAPWKTDAELALHRRDLARILAEDVNADIVCVLEVTSRAALDKLAAEPALRKSGYRALHLESGDTGTGQDVAFLVRVPLDRFDGAEIRRFADTARRELSSRRKPKARARLTKHAVVCLSSPVRLCVMGVHLLAHPDDRGRTARREVQAGIAAGLVRREIADKGYLPVVLGDFNDFDPAVTPDSVSKKKRRVLALFKDFDASRPGPELFNAAERIPSGERFSAYWDKNKNGKREAVEPVSLIDHILLDRSLAKRLVRAAILHESQDGSVSDHWPVVVEIGMP